LPKWFRYMLCVHPALVAAVAEPVVVELRVLDQDLARAVRRRASENAVLIVVEIAVADRQVRRLDPDARPVPSPGPPRP